MSDSHGELTTFRWLLEQLWQEIPSLDYYIFCGDGIRDFETINHFIMEHDPAAKSVAVGGNCDFCSSVPERQIVDVCGTSVFITHGHLYRVKNGLGNLDTASKDCGCKMTLYGHTHIPNLEMKQTLMMNPGAIKDGRIGIIEFGEDGKINGRLLSF